MECQKAFRLLNAFLEGDLKGAQARRMEKHLASCSACRAELEGLKRSLALLEGLPSLVPPPGLASRVMARVLQPERALARAGSGTLGWVVASVLGGLGSLLVYLYLDEQGWPWDAVAADSAQPVGLGDLASLLAGMEVGVVIGVTLLFVALVSLLIQLMGKELRSQHGYVKR